MKHISEIVKTESLSVKREETEENSALNPHVVAVVNKVFSVFYTICRGFEKQYHDPKRLNMEKTLWYKGFTKLGLDSLAKVKLGLEKCNIESPINTPTLKQFVEWCTPTAEDLNLPSLDFAYDEACKNAHPSANKLWTHEVVKHAAKATGSYLLSNSPRSKSFPVFQRNYEIACRKFIKGESISDIPKGIADHRKSREGVLPEFQACNSYESAMESIKQKLRMK